MVEPAHRRAPGAPPAVRAHRPFQPRLRPPGPRGPVLGDREPDQPLVGHARARRRPVLRGGTAQPLRLARGAGDQPGGGLPGREVEGAPARSPGARRRALPAHGRRQSPRPDREGARPGAVPARGEAEHRRLRGGDRPVRLARRPGGGRRPPRLRAGRHRARAGVPRVRRGGDRPGGGDGRPLPLRDPDRARRAAGFNLCPADICQGGASTGPARGLSPRRRPVSPSPASTRRWRRSRRCCGSPARPPSTSAASSTWWPGETGGSTTTTSTPRRTSWPTRRRCSGSIPPPASPTTSRGSRRGPRARPAAPALAAIPAS